MKYYKLYIIGICMLSGLHLAAQVTIGSVAEPEEAALLDIKSIHNTRPPIGGKPAPTTDKGGLLLPRVALTNKNDLSPFIEENRVAPQEYARLKKVYTGMIVYNIAPSNVLSKGLYVWDGTQWYGVSNEINNTDWHVKGNSGINPPGDFLGTKDQQGLSIKTGGTDRIRITKEGNIGINKTEPAKALDVNADVLFNNRLYLKGIKEAPTENTRHNAFLMRDNQTGEIFSSPGMHETKFKPYSFLKYEISNLNLANDVECTLDTQIPGDEYVVIVVGSRFRPYTTDPPYSHVAGLLPKDNKSKATYNPKTVYAARNNGTNTWYLYANYPGGKTSFPDKSGKWELYCLAVNISVVKTLPNQVYNMKNSIYGIADKIEGL